MNFGIEDERIEFKKSTAELTDAVKSICAILNKHGCGTLYFGILPNGEVKGQDVSETTLRNISRKIFESIFPQIIPTISKKIVDSKEIVEVSFKGSEKPYSCNGIYYIRVADEDKVLKPNELRQLFEYNNGISWDSMLTNFTIEEIDVDTFKRFYNKCVSCGRIKDNGFDVYNLLVKLGLLKNNLLTNAGYYLFSKSKPVVIKMAIFATDEKLTFLDINRLSGNIYSLIEESNSYVKKNIRWKADIINDKRVETPEIPLEALREIICNSFLHARYNTNTEHEIDIHPSFIKIYNPGEFPIGYKPEDFIEGNIPSIIRNPLILKTLYLSEDAESYSSGLKRVYEKCREYNILPTYENQRVGFTFIFNRVLLNKDFGNSFKLNDDEKDVLNIIKKDPNSSASSISKTLYRSDRTIQRILKSLRENGFIKHIGKTKGYWVVL